MEKCYTHFFPSVSLVLTNSDSYISSDCWKVSGLVLSDADFNADFNETLEWVNYSRWAEGSKCHPVPFQCICCSELILVDLQLNKWPCGRNHMALIYSSEKGGAGLNHPATHTVHFQVAFILFLRREHSASISKALV